MKSLSRIAEVFELISNSSDGLTVTEIASQLGISRASSSKLMISLAEAGFLEKDVSQRYVLDFNFWTWGTQAVRRARLLDIARPSMISTVAESGLTIYVAMKLRDQVLYLEKAFLFNGVPVIMPISSVSSSIPGIKRPLHATAPGKAILAYSPEKVVRSILDSRLEAFTPRTLANSDALESELQAVRARGYAVNRGEFSGFYALAVPLLDSLGEAVGAVGTSRGIVGDQEEDFLNAQLLVMTKLGESISARLGYYAHWDPSIC